MDKTEAKEILLDMANELQLIPESKQGQAFKMALKLFDNENVLDKIRDEIMQLYNEVEVVDYDHNDVFRIKKAHWIIREEVLWIIDKYKKVVRLDDKNIANNL